MGQKSHTWAPLSLWRHKFHNTAVTAACTAMEVLCQKYSRLQYAAWTFMFFPTAVCASSWCSVLQQPVLSQDLSVFNSSLCCARRSLAYSSFCCTWDLSVFKSLCITSLSKRAFCAAAEHAYKSMCCVCTCLSRQTEQGKGVGAGEGEAVAVDTSGNLPPVS